VRNQLFRRLPTRPYQLVVLVVLSWVLTMAVPGSAAAGSPDPTDTPLANGIQISDSMPPSPSQSSWRYYYVDIPAGTTNLSVNLYYFGGDSDLYLLFNAKPTLDTFGCRPFSGLGPEECRAPFPSAGRWWIGVNNFDASPIPISYVLWVAWTVPGNLVFRDGFESGSNSAWLSSAGLQANLSP